MGTGIIVKAFLAPWLIVVALRGYYWFVRFNAIYFINLRPAEFASSGDGFKHEERPPKPLAST
jgi:hypothetical protein